MNLTPTDLEQEGQGYDVQELIDAAPDPIKVKAEAKLAARRMAVDQANDLEMMVSGEEGFQEVAKRRGFLDGYESAASMVPREDLRRKLTRDSFVQDVTGASIEDIKTGVPQLQVAKAVLGLDDPSDEAFDAGLANQAQKQKTYREKSEQIYRLSFSSALKGEGWYETRQKAQAIAGADWLDHEQAFNKGQEDVFADLNPDDIKDVDAFFNFAANIEGAEVESTGGNIRQATANYATKTPEQREKIMNGIAMRAISEGQDIDNFFGRLGQAFRSGTTNIATSLTARTGRVESGRINEFLAGGVTRQDAPEITPGNVSEAVRQQTKTPDPYGVSEYIGAGGIPTRPLTDKEKAVLKKAADEELGGAQFLMDLQNAGVKVKRYQQKNTDGGWFFGGSFVDALVGFAESAPSMLVTALPYAGPAIMATSYTEQERARLENQFPDADKTTLETQALAVGSWMAGMDVVQNKLLTARVPRLNAALLQWKTPGAIALAGGRAGVTGVTETAQEVAQDIGAPVVQSIAAALSEDIKGPDWGEWMEREWDALGDIFRVSMLMGIVGGAGSTISDYMDGNRLKEILKDRSQLALAGIPEAQATEIAQTAESSPAAAAQLLQSAMIETKPEERQRISKTEQIRLEVEAANTTLRDAGLPEMEMQEDGKALVRYNDGVTNDRLFDTPEEARADMAAMVMDGEISIARANRELLDNLTRSYEAQGDLQLETQQVERQSLQDWAGDNAERISIARQRALIYLRQAENDMGMTPAADGSDIDLSKFFVQGSSRNEFADGVTKIVAELATSANPLTVLEEAIEGVGKYIMNSRGVARETMTGWIRETEQFTGQKILADDFTGLTPDLQFQEIIEGWSKIGVAYATGRIMDSSIPSQIRNFFRAIKRIISEILRLADGVKRFSESGKMDPEMRYWLDVAAGFDTDGELARQRRQAEQEIAQTFSLGNEPELFNDPILAQPVNSHEYSKRNVSPGDRETLQRSASGFGGRSLTAVDSENLGAITRRVFEQTGLGVRFFQIEGNPEPQTGGFLNPDNPDTIFINADCPAPLGSILAHEWVHAVERDPAKAPLLTDFSELIEPLFAPGALDRAKKTLAETYADDQVSAEVIGNVLSDALTGNGTWGSQELFSDWQAVRDAAMKLWQDANPLSPSALKPSPDESLSITAEGDPIAEAIDKLRKTPEAKAKIYKAMKVALADVRRRWTEKAKDSNLRQRDFDQFRDLAKLEAIARALPKEIRGVLTSGFRSVAELRTTEARENYIASLLPKVEAAVETNLQKTLRDQIKKLMKKGSVKKTEARTRGGKIGGVGHAVFEQAKEAMGLVDDIDGKSALQKADEMADALRDKLEGELTDEQFAEIDARIAAIELFADYRNADSVRLTDALGLLEGTYLEGRKEWLEVLKARRDQRAERVNTTLQALGIKGRITDAQRNAAKAKFDRFWSRFSEGIMEAGLSGSQKIRRLSEATDDAAFKALAEDMEMAALDAELKQQDTDEADKRALGVAMRRIFGVTTEYGVSKKLHELTQRKVAPVEKIEGQAEQTIKVPKDMVQSILDGEVDGFEMDGQSVILNEDDLQALEIAQEEFEAKSARSQASSKTVNFTRTIAEGERITIGEVNQLEALQLWLTMRQPDQADKLARLGYDEQTMAQLEEWLRPEVKALGLWMVDHIGAEAYTIDQLHRSEKGVGLRLVENYFPVRNDVSGSDNKGLSIDGTKQHTGKSVGALKERVKNNAPPAYVNAVAVFLASRAQINFWKSHVSFLREWGGLVRDEKFAAAVKTRMGDTYYNALRQMFRRIESGGALNAAALLDMENVIRGITRNFALATLGGRVSTLAINTTAALNAALEIPGNELLKGLADLAQRPEAFKDAFNSPAIQRRLKTGGTFEAQLARKKGSSDNPVLAVLNSAAEKGVMPINWVDTGSQLIGSAIAWEYTRKQAIASGMTEEAARLEADRKVERIMLRAAQPTTRLAKSEFELKVVENPLGALFALFTTEPRKNLAIAYLAARELITGKGNYGKAMAAQQLAIVALVQTTAAFLIRSLYDAIARPKDNEDEDLVERLKKRMDPKAFVYSLSTEHLKSVPIFGEVYNEVMAKALDQPTFDSSQNPLNRATGKVLTLARTAFDDEKLSPEKAIEGAIDAVQSFGSLLPGGAVFAQGGNTAEFIEGVSTTVDPELLSDEDRIRRIKARYNAEKKKADEELGKTSSEDGKIDKEKQRKKWARLSDRLRSELLPLQPELRKKALEEIDPPDSVKKMIEVR